MRLVSTRNDKRIKRLGEPSKSKGDENLKMFPLTPTQLGIFLICDDSPSPPLWELFPTETWDFLKIVINPLAGNISQVSTLLLFTLSLEKQI